MIIDISNTSKYKEKIIMQIVLHYYEYLHEIDAVRYILIN